MPTRTLTENRHVAMPTCMLVTVGCAKNEVDTDRMRALLLESGFEETAAPDDADVIIINTCSFLGVATQESVETVLSLAQVSTDDEDGRPRIIMCGCVPSRYGDELAPELPEVDAFVPSDQEDGIVSIARDFVRLGFEVASTGGTAKVLTASGVPCKVVRKVSEPSPNIGDMIASGEVQLMINTPFGRGTRSDGYELRLAAVRHGITYATTIAGAQAFAEAMEVARLDGLGIIALQDLPQWK